jgi:ATP phosphoribosyltransferase regulatory subunit
MLAMTGVQDVHLDLGHVGIYRALVEQAGLDTAQETALFDVLQRKARPELADLMVEFALDAHHSDIFKALPRLNGGVDVLSKAGALLGAANDTVKQALQDLQAMANRLQRDYPALNVSFDLAELRGYHYHTGMVFAAFVPSVGREIARGGRYDNIGGVFGRARPATGFSADLKVLVSLLDTDRDDATHCIFAPAVDDADLAEVVRDLRADGHRVIRQLPGQSGAAEQLGCSAQLEKQGKKWVASPLASR